jgi:hypothetical protein
MYGYDSSQRLTAREDGTAGVKTRLTTIMQNQKKTRKTKKNK